jgi:hypothetical protein
MVPNLGRDAALLAAIAACGLLIGCGIGRSAEKVVEAVSGGLSDTCGEFMRAAFPVADIRITKREASGTGINTVVAHVEGVRKDLPKDVPLSHDLAAECQFTDNVLTGFKWTRGPLH